MRYSVETVAKSAAYGVRRLVGLGPSVGSDPISSSGSGPGSSGSGGTNIDRHSYWSGRHDQFSRKEPPFSVNGSSSSDPGSSGGGTGGGGARVATSGGASSAGTYTVSSSGGGGGGARGTEQERQSAPT